jgi:hypothetical protein
VQPALGLRMVAEQVQGEGERGRRGLVASEQEDQDLIPDLLVVEPVAGLGVPGVQEQRDEILHHRRSLPSRPGRSGR